MKRQVVIAAILCVVSFSCHVAIAGSIESWGANNNGLRTQMPIEDDFIAVTVGASHAIALKSDGTVVGWGNAADNRLDIPDTNDIVAIAAGLDFTLALKADGSIIGWGKDINHQIRDIPSGNDFVAIAAGDLHGLAIRDNGSAVGWGYNSEGVSTPPIANDFLTLPEGGTIGAGAFHSVAIRGNVATGSIEVWGTAIWRLLDDAPEGSDFIAVDGGHSHGLALRADGSLAAWGWDADGQISETPTEGEFAAIAAGDNFNVALKADGTLDAWGNDDDGRTNVPEGNSFVAIAAGVATGFAISQPGSLTLTSPNGAEVLNTGNIHTITWDTEGNVADVLIEYSTDNGADWISITPANEGNTGSYEWLVPVATSQECLVRVRRARGIAEGGDQSDAPLTIYYCPLSGDVTGDCVVNLADIAVIESQWLQSYDPFAEPFSKVDFNDDGSVNLADLMIMGTYWLDPDCGEFGCEGTNVDGLGRVDMKDMARLGEYWGTN